MQALQKIMTILLFFTALAIVCFAWMLFDQREIFKERLRTLEGHVQETANATKWGDFEIQAQAMRERPDLLGSWPYESRVERARLDRDLQDYQRLHEPLERLHMVIEDRQKTMETNKLRLDQKQLDLDHEKDKYIMCSQDLMRSRGDLVELAAALDDAKQNVAMKLSQISGLEDKLLAAKSTNFELEDTVRDCRTDLEAKKAEIEEATIEIADLMTVIASINTPPPTEGGIFAISAVEKEWRFIVVPKKPGDRLIPSTEGLIHRGSELIGKAVISRVEPDYVIAQLLKEWEKDDIRPGDAIMF